jgi:hypothetical protein
MPTLTLICVFIAVIGAVFAIVGFKRLFQRRFIKAIGLEISAAILLLLAASAFLLASNLHTYQRLTYEQAVAEISLNKLADQSFSVEMKSLDSDYQQSFNINGDEWQLDAQVLTWQGLATLLGFDAHYRLHRISGRYLDIEDEQKAPRTVYSLLQPKPYIEDYIDNDKTDLWKFAHKHRNWMRWVDAAYGSAVFLPMTDGAKYKVSISRTGLVARPANDVARKAVSRWISL